MNIWSLSIEQSEDTSQSIDKLLKFALHLTNEIDINPKTADFFRWENYVIETLDYLESNREIDEFNYWRIRRKPVEEAIHTIIEVLLLNDFFVDSSSDIDDSSYSISRTFAIYIYEKLWTQIKARNKKFFKLTAQEEQKLIEYHRAARDEELHQMTLEIVSALSRWIISDEKSEYTAENIGLVEEYLALLRKKWIISDDDHTNLLSVEDIEDMIVWVIHHKVFTAWKIEDGRIRDLFYGYYDTYKARVQKETRDTVNRILDEDWDELSDYQDLDEYPFFHLLQSWIIILLNPRDLQWELKNYDYEGLITSMTEYDLIGPDIAQMFLDQINEEPSDVVWTKIIFRLFQIFYKSNFVSEVNIDDDDKERVMRHLDDNNYALNMLYKNDIPK